MSCFYKWLHVTIQSTYFIDDTNQILQAAIKASEWADTRHNQTPALYHYLLDCNLIIWGGEGQGSVVRFSFENVEK